MKEKWSVVEWRLMEILSPDGKTRHIVRRRPIDLWDRVVNEQGSQLGMHSIRDVLCTLCGEDIREHRSVKICDQFHRY